MKSIKTSWLPIALVFSAVTFLGAETQEAVRIRVQTIQAKVARIESATRKAVASGELLEKELPHWKFEGLRAKSDPIYLSATLSEGRMVREETYYFEGGNLLLVKLFTFWDEDKPAPASRRSNGQDFYVEKNQIILHVIKTESDPPNAQSDYISEPAADLIARSKLIAKILLGKTKAGAQDALGAFPEIPAVEGREAEAGL